MAVFKCKLCGGTIEPRDGGIGICDSCGTKQTIPNTNDEKKMNLLDRANHFRMQNEFDKAMGIYEQVLEEDTEDSDIYYAIALCRYGITYVDDPKTKKKIPTINRMQSKMFTKDADFIMAVEKAEPEQVKLYNEEGSYIDKVQTGILDITKNEKPYDVFICYKETDDNGERTHDSVLANDLYYGLTNEGFKVFFAKITLEGKLGTAYEPYIFSALNSSKVMVVLGTKKEYFNAVWVKNEWSRFLTFINNGEKKTLIPAYKDMDPYDLPDEFANLQAQDMSKLGFMQDLIRGIKKIIGGTTEKGNIGSRSGNNENINSLLKRIKVFLEDGDFNRAIEYCEKSLDIDAENSDVYLYYLLAETKSKNIEQLKFQHTDLSQKSNFVKALKYGDEKQKEQLIELNNDIIYYSANNLFTNEKYINAIEQYKKIIDFKDSKNKMDECKNKIYDIAINQMQKGQFNDAIYNFNSIKDYKDSNAKIEECKKIISKLLYDNAMRMIDSNNYEVALQSLYRIPDLQSFPNSNEMMKKCLDGFKEEKYKEAERMFVNYNYDQAFLIYKDIIDYKDAKKKCLKCAEKSEHARRTYAGTINEITNELKKENDIKNQERIEKAKEIANKSMETTKNIANKIGGLFNRIKAKLEDK